jgi:hypothetical protein
MKTKTGILAISAVILLTSLSVSPALATPTQAPTPVQNSLAMTEAQITKLEKVLPAFFDELSLVKDEAGFNQLVGRYFNRFGDHPFFRFLHHLAVRNFIQRHILCLTHLRTSAWVLSFGTVNRLFCHTKLQVCFSKPYALWFYGNQACPLMRSRTFVLDFHPFSILNVEGRQIGFMRNFLGIYMERNRPLIGGDYTFFFGHVGRIRAYDLSPFT